MNEKRTVNKLLPSLSLIIQEEEEDDDSIFGEAQPFIRFGCGYGPRNRICVRGEQLIRLSANPPCCRRGPTRVYQRAHVCCKATQNCNDQAPTPVCCKFENVHRVLQGWDLRHHRLETSRSTCSRVPERAPCCPSAASRGSCSRRTTF